MFFGDRGEKAKLSKSLNKQVIQQVGFTRGYSWSLPKKEKKHRASTICYCGECHHCPPYLGEEYGRLVASPKSDAVNRETKNPSSGKSFTEVSVCGHFSQVLGNNCESAGSSYPPTCLCLSHIRAKSSDAEGSDSTDDNTDWLVLRLYFRVLNCRTEPTPCFMVPQKGMHALSSQLPKVRWYLPLS